jgi:hypothetical protein
MTHGTVETADAVDFVRDALETLPPDPATVSTEELRQTILAINDGLTRRVEQLLADMRELGRQVLEQPADTAANAERLQDAEWLRVLIHRCTVAQQHLIVYAGRAAAVHGITVTDLVAGG